MTSKPFGISCLVFALVSAFGLFVEQAWAVPPNGFLLIFTVNAGTGLREPNVPVTVRQIRGSVPYPTLATTTDDYGRLYIDVPPGTYQIRAADQVGGPVNVSVASEGEVYVSLLVKPESSALASPVGNRDPGGLLATAPGED
jgi:hypothetical protein